MLILYINKFITNLQALNNNCIVLVICNAQLRIYLVMNSLLLLSLLYSLHFCMISSKFKKFSPSLITFVL